MKKEASNPYRLLPKIDDVLAWPEFIALLERTDRAAAMGEYAAAIEIDGDRALAHFNLGALYVNDAVALFQEANAEEDYLMAESLQAEGKAKFLLARPYLERALELEPGNRAVIQALMQIAIQTDDIEAYRRLQGMEAALEEVPVTVV